MLCVGWSVWSFHPTLWPFFCFDVGMMSVFQTISDKKSLKRSSREASFQHEPSDRSVFAIQEQTLFLFTFWHSY